VAGRRGPRHCRGTVFRSGSSGVRSRSAAWSGSCERYVVRFDRLTLLVQAGPDLGQDPGDATGERGSRRETNGQAAEPKDYFRSVAPRPDPI
jgi:hypothetical protein